MPLAMALNSTNVRNFIALRVAQLVSHGKAVDIAARMFATPPRHPHTERELELLAGGIRHDVNLGFHRLATWRFGRADRPAIVLSHGWGGRGAQFRAFVPALLGAGWQVVAFDHVGHGQSGGREASLIHFIDAVDAVVRDVEEKGGRMAGFIGHSLGAAAVGAWLDRTRRDLPAVLVAPPTSIERYSNRFARALGIPESVRRAMQERFEHAFGRRWSEFELPHSVSHVRARALVIHDAGDAEVPFAAGESLARAWPGAALRRTEGLGHRRILRDAEVVQDAVDFLADRVVFAPPPAEGGRTFGAPAPIS